MGVLGRRQRLVAGRARERPGVELRRVLRHRLAAADPELRASVLLPVLGDHYGEVLERGELQLQFEADAGDFGCATTSTAFRSIRATTAHPDRGAPRALPAQADVGAGRGWLERAGHALGACRARDAGDVRAAAERTATRSVLKAPARAAGRRQPAAGARRSRTCVARAQRHAPASRASFDALRRAARGAGLPARLLARGRRRHQLPALLRHQRRWRRCAWSAPTVFEATHRLVLELAAERRGRRPAHRPSRRPGRPGGATSSGCSSATPSGRRRPDGRARAGAPLYVVIEKILRRTSSCRATGRCTAPPATASPTWSTGCSSMPRAGRGSTRV